MKEVNDVLSKLWSSFINPLDKEAIPAWEVGYVPKDKQNVFPRFTYMVGVAGFAKGTILTSTIWDRRSPAGYFGIVDDVANQALEKIPESGILLTLDNGKGVLWVQRSNPFIIPLDDPEDNLVTRRIINIVVNSYVS